MGCQELGWEVYVYDRVDARHRELHVYMIDGMPGIEKWMFMIDGMSEVGKFEFMIDGMQGTGKCTFEINPAKK